MQVDEAMHEGIVAARREQRREIKIVYSVGSIYVEYHDGTEWVTADFIDDIPATSELTYGVNIRDSFPVSWRIRNATVQQNTGQWPSGRRSTPTSPASPGSAWTTTRSRPVHGLYLKTDNVVYSVGSIYVEYYDLVEPAWVTAQTIDSIPANSELTYGIGPTMACGGNVTSLPFATSMASSRMVFNVPYGMNVSPLSS